MVSQNRDYSSKLETTYPELELRYDVPRGFGSLAFL